MPSDDDGLAPTEGPDWENGFSDSLRNFEEAVTLWRRREEATCEEKIAGRNLNQRTVASCDFTAEDCLKAHFPAREDDESDAPLQALVKVAKSQREELQEVLELVRNHAERFEGHSSLTAQLPEQGSASARKSGADVVALLAELLDVASRNFSKRGKEDLASLRQERNGRGRDEHRLRERREVRKDDYRRDDRRREEDERYEDDRRRARDGAGRDDGRRDRDRDKDDYDHRRDERRHDDRYEDDRRGREGGRDDGRHYRAKDDYRRDDRRDDRYDDRRPPGPRREERPRSRSRGDAAA